MKRPERYEVHKLLISKSADWVEIARELRVDDNYRKQLRKYLQESSEEDVLEKVLARWIESETCEVTWKCIINVLKELKYITLLKMVQKHLRKEDVIKKYSKTPDFQFTGERLMKILFIYYSLQIEYVNARAYYIHELYF